jgi:type VI secretion system protein VasG
MTEINRSALFGRLSPTGLKSIETATGFCKMRGNPYVELVHWIHILLQDPQNDLAAIRTRFALDDTKLARDVVAALDGLPRGATAISDFSPQIEEAIEKGWLYASLMFQAGRVRTGHLVFGMLKTPILRNALFAISPEFRKVSADALGDEFDRSSRTRPRSAALPWSTGPRTPPEPLGRRSPAVRAIHWPSIPSTSPNAPGRARSTRSSGATPRSAR